MERAVSQRLFEVIERVWFKASRLAQKIALQGQVSTIEKLALYDRGLKSWVFASTYTRDIQLLLGMLLTPFRLEARPDEVEHFLTRALTFQQWRVTFSFIGSKVLTALATAKSPNLAVHPQTFYTRFYKDISQLTTPGAPFYFAHSTKAAIER